MSSLLEQEAFSLSPMAEAESREEELGSAWAFYCKTGMVVHSFHGKGSIAGVQSFLLLVVFLWIGCQWCICLAPLLVVRRGARGEFAVPGARDCQIQRAPRSLIKSPRTRPLCAGPRAAPAALGHAPSLRHRRRRRTSGALPWRRGGNNNNPLAAAANQRARGVAL